MEKIKPLYRPKPNKLMGMDDNEKKRLMPYVFGIIIVGAIIIIMLVDWLFGLF